MHFLVVALELLLEVLFSQTASLVLLSEGVLSSMLPQSLIEVYVQWIILRCHGWLIAWVLFVCDYQFPQCYFCKIVFAAYQYNYEWLHELASQQTKMT